jgi:outer membrane protein assembly factor BamA
MRASESGRGRFPVSSPAREWSARRSVGFHKPALRSLICWLCVCAAFFCFCLPATADEATGANALPSFTELQAAGAVIGEVRIANDNIFDLDDPKEDNFLFRFANKLHIRTRPSVIERSLLFHSGEPLSVRLIEESERLLHANRYIYDVDIHPIAWHDGIVDIEVKTRDTWTLQPGFQFSRSGGSNSSSLTLKEQNLLGTGTSLSYAKTSDVDRKGSEFQISQDHAFGGWTHIDLNLANYDDGKHQSFAVGRPFYALDTRWAAGGSALHDERIESVYQDGNVIGQYRHKQDAGEAYGGWSKGLIDGWAQRYSTGLSYQADTYTVDPSLVPPPVVPADQTLVSPFVRYELIEDNYEKVKNRDQIQRPEFFAMGFHSNLQINRALTSLGSTTNLWTYSANAGDGFQAPRGNDMLISTHLSGQYGDGHGQREGLGGSVRYWVPQGKRTLFYAAASGDIVRNPETSDLLLLGGDNGLRGYPLRYQSGEQRALFSVEERAYTDWYPFRLFRVGGAVFYDIGRAWGGPFQNPVNPGWLSDVGFGLRILNDRASFGNVLHVDVAFPLNPDQGIRSWQFLIRSYATF